MTGRRVLIPILVLLAMVAGAVSLLAGPGASAQTGDADDAQAQADQAAPEQAANEPPQATLELTIWQGVDRPLDFWISSRADDETAWTQAELEMALQEGGGWRVGDLTVTAGEHDFDLRLWHDPAETDEDTDEVWLSARLTGELWSDYGTQQVELDQVSESGDWNYANVSLALPLRSPTEPNEDPDAVVFAVCPPEDQTKTYAYIYVWQRKTALDSFWITSRTASNQKWQTVKLSLTSPETVAADEAEDEDAGATEDSDGQEQTGAEEAEEQTWNTADLTIAGRRGALDLRLWQDTDNQRNVWLSARSSGAGWDDYGTKQWSLDRTSKSGRYWYRLQTVTVAVPDNEAAEPGSSTPNWESWDCNNAPTANAGEDQTVNANTTVTLDGTASSDPDGDALTYAWTGPEDIELTDADTDTATFTTTTAQVGDTLTFTLTVTDPGGKSGADDVEITVQQPAPVFFGGGGGGTPPTSPGQQVNATLNVSAVAVTSATLTIVNHDEEWWYKADTAPHTTCQGPIAASTDTASLTGLTASTRYIYKAYSATGCADTDLLATAGAFTTDDPSLSVSNVTATTATLTLVGHTGNWYYKAAPTIDCSGPVTGATLAITSITPSTDYTASAYSDSSCANLLATKQFSTLDTGLAASNITATTATLTIDGNHTGQWWYKATTGPHTTCQDPVAANTAKDLTGLSPGTTYTYSAYSATGCASANLLATAAAFTTSASLSAGTPTATTATLTIAGHTAQWWYKATTGPHTTCQGPVAANTAAKTVTGLAIGTSYTYSAYGDSSCANLLATAAAVTTETPALAASNETATGATLTLTNWTIAKDGSWYYKYTSPNGGTCSTAQSALTATVGSLSPGTMYTFKVYSDNGCSTVIATASPFTTKPQLTATGVTTTGATLNLYGHTANTEWWYKSTTTGQKTCTSAGTGTSVTLTGLDEGTSYTYSAYSDSTCTAANLLATASPFTTGISLTASNVSATGATLTIAGHTAQWWYNATTGPHSDCQGPVAANTATQALTGLSPGTSYTYSAYSASGCARANQLATASSFTTLAQLTTSNPTARGVTLNLAGHSGAWWYKSATTGKTDCTSAGTSASANVTGLTPNTAYVFTAYSNSGCSTSLDEAPEFTTPVEFTAGTPTATTVTLTIAGHSEQWWFKSTTTGHTTCTGPVPAGATSATRTGLTPRTSYTFSAYSASGCASANLLATAAAFTTKVAELTTRNVTKYSVKLLLSNWDTVNELGWYFKSATTGATTCTSAGSTSQYTLRGLTAGTAYVFTAYSNSACTTVIDAAPSFTTTANAAPTLSVPSSANVTASNPYSPSATANDPDDDNDDLTWAWSWTGPSILIKGADTATPTFSIPNGYVGMKYTVSVTITDEDGATASGSIALTIHNRAPNAVASGTSAGLGGATIYLHGFNSTDPDSGQTATLTCRFAKTGGTYTGTVTITSPNACTGARFVMPSDATSGQTIIVTLTVTDSKGGTDTDDWTVTASTPNQAPSANAGPDQTVIAGATVALDGSGSSDPNDGDTLTYQWSKTDGTYTGSITLNNPTSATPTFAWPSDAGIGKTVQLRLTVSDGKATDTDDIIVRRVNGVPTVSIDGGDRTEYKRTDSVARSFTVTADISDDPDGHTLSYTWLVRRVGSNDAPTGVTIAKDSMDPKKAEVTISNAVAGATGTDYQIFLTVRDSQSATTTDAITMKVKDNSKPAVSITTADITGGTRNRTYDLAASADDGDSHTLTYTWTVTAGTGMSFTNGNTATPTLNTGTTVNPGTYTITVQVSDGIETSTDTMTIQIQ